MANTLEPAKPIDVKMFHSTFLTLLAADNRLDRINVFHLQQLCAPRTIADDASDTPRLCGDVLASQPLVMKMKDLVYKGFVCLPDKKSEPPTIGQIGLPLGCS